jgi:hypothetical protein
LAISDANKKHYFETVKIDEAKSICTSFAKDGQTIVLRGEGRPETELENFEILSFNPETMVMGIRSKGSLLAKLTGSPLTGKVVFVKMSSSRFHLFTTSKLVFDEESKDYTLTLDAAFFKGQQRSNYRLMASTFIKIQFKINNDEVYEGLDVSAGGTSFIVPADKVDQYEKGSEFLENTLRLNKVNFTIPRCRVAVTWDQHGTDGHPTGEKKLGISFIDLPLETEEALFKHINGEARAEEMLKKMAEKKKK